MSTETDAALRAAAEAATPGDWAADVREDGRAWIDIAGIDDHAWGMHGWGPEATFIAAANPAAILDLLDRVREAEAKVAVVNAQLESERAWLLEWIDGQLEALPEKRTPSAHGKADVLRELRVALGDPQ